MLLKTVDISEINIAAAKESATQQIIKHSQNGLIRRRSAVTVLLFSLKLKIKRKRKMRWVREIYI